MSRHSGLVAKVVNTRTKLKVGFGSSTARPVPSEKAVMIEANTGTTPCIGEIGKDSKIQGLAKSHGT